MLVQRRFEDSAPLIRWCVFYINRSALTDLIMESHLHWTDTWLKPEHDCTLRLQCETTESIHCTRWSDRSASKCLAVYTPCRLKALFWLSFRSGIRTSLEWTLSTEAEMFIWTDLNTYVSCSVGSPELPRVCVQGQMWWFPNSSLVFDPSDSCSSCCISRTPPIWRVYVTMWRFQFFGCLSGNFLLYTSDERLGAVDAAGCESSTCCARLDVGARVCCASSSWEMVSYTWVTTPGKRSTCF